MPREISNPDPRETNGRESRINPPFPAEPQPDDGEPNFERGAAPERFSITRPRLGALDSPRAYYCANRVYLLRESELRTLAEIGTFRAIAAADLGRLGYGGDSKRMERDVRHLRDDGLVSEKVVRADRKSTLRLLALTREGARLTRQSALVSEDQTLFHGFVKLHEAKHDASLYRLYHAQAQRIESSGGRVTRVVLGHELQRNLNRELAALESWPEERERIALRHGLAVVDEKVPIPDMRIEYDTADMERGHLDVELATRNYRPQALSEKARAGFSLYALPEDAPRLRRVLDQRKIAAPIVSL
jgi:hypothetical protein